ncbi:hypothetical protein Poli38472_013495 [Pythium oligandrum]|uniref:Uncharacterized protein n=1 Tax=Pythium oligandrum TaxID=41045 RepID=A0A8K1FD78_PYTOL|nr:hypothetical protein Poli38472_013495 [Pythium oligandrum]|eukprot:TMW58021.1 hypothetical protein Poli38472_013495 [Pythium oligandrum]
MCFLCSADPVEEDPRKTNVNKFSVSMMDAPRTDPICCLGSCVCPCCAQIYIRRKALHYDMTNYRCCQGYMDGFVPCLKSGECGESSCPNMCLCLEAFLCNGCAVSSTRLLVMDRHRLQPDEWDNRIIRCNNCLQVVSIVCDLLAICVSGAQDCAQMLHCVAQCTYASTQGCMTAQVNVELDERSRTEAPSYQDMERV